MVIGLNIIIERKEIRENDKRERGMEKNMIREKYDSRKKYTDRKIIIRGKIY